MLQNSDAVVKHALNVMKYWDTASKNIGALQKWSFFFKLKKKKL